MERTAMSTWDFKRLAVIRRVLSGELSLGEAASVLGIGAGPRLPAGQAGRPALADPRTEGSSAIFNRSRTHGEARRGHGISPRQVDRTPIGTGRPDGDREV